MQDVDIQDSSNRDPWHATDVLRFGPQINNKVSNARRRPLSDGGVISIKVGNY